MVIPAERAALKISSAVPVIVETPVASTATEVIASTVDRSLAVAPASVTVTVSALLLFASVSVVSVSRSPSVIVAVTTPVV